MSSYCGYCGRPLEEGERCDCPESLAAREDQRIETISEEKPAVEEAVWSSRQEESPATSDLPAEGETAGSEAPSADAAEEAPKPEDGQSGWTPPSGGPSMGYYPPPRFVQPKIRLAPQLRDAFGLFWKGSAVERLCVHGSFRAGYLVLAISLAVTAAINLIVNLGVGSMDGSFGAYLRGLVTTALTLVVGTNLTAGLLALVARIVGRKIPFKRAFLACCVSGVPAIYLTPVFLLLTPFCFEISWFTIDIHPLPLAILVALVCALMIFGIAIVYSGLAGESGTGDRTTLVMAIAYAIEYFLLFLLLFVILRAEIQAQMGGAFGGGYGTTLPW